MMTTSHLKVAATTLVFSAALMLQSVQAATFAANSGALGANDTLSWSTVATPVTFLNTSNFAASSASGLGVSVSQSGGNFDIRAEGTGWLGNFAVGAPLLRSFGPITLTFATPITGVGAQIQPNFTGAFTGTIQAFGFTNVSLGLFSLSGVSNGLQDNSAIFLGIFAPEGISRVVFDVAGPADFAINSLSINNTPVPEPLTMAGLFVFGGIVATQRKRKSL